MDISHQDGLLTLRLALGRRLVTVSIPRVFLLLLALVGLLSYGLGRSQTSAEARRQAQMLTVVSERNQQLERAIAQKELERDQMVSLAEARSEELWRELEGRDRELERLWRMVGSSPRESARHSLLGSRGDATRRALAVKADYSNLGVRFQESGQELKDLAAAAEQFWRVKLRAERERLVRITPSISPCKGEMTSGYGHRVHPIYGVNKLHSGCDFTAAHGTPIWATAAGTVSSSDWLGGYGKTVEIEHGEGLKTLYAHCDELKVKKGQTVRRGQLIATVGTTGLSSGPHCHYEIHKDGKPIDPASYLR
jgi:murein DD-endopeptidase MepM/ murein hydrolase activator NlpD